MRNILLLLAFIFTSPLVARAADSATDKVIATIDLVDLSFRFRADTDGKFNLVSTTYTGMTTFKAEGNLVMGGTESNRETQTVNPGADQKTSSSLVVSFTPDGVAHLNLKLITSDTESDPTSPADSKAATDSITGSDTKPKTEAKPETNFIVDAKFVAGTVDDFNAHRKVTFKVMTETRSKLYQFIEQMFELHPLLDESLPLGEDKDSILAAHQMKANKPEFIGNISKTVFIEAEGGVFTIYVPHVEESLIRSFSPLDQPTPIVPEP